MGERLLRAGGVVAGVSMAATAVAGCGGGGEAPESNSTDPLTQPERRPNATAPDLGGAAAKNCIFNKDTTLTIGSDEAGGETETVFPGGIEFPGSSTAKEGHGGRLFRPILRANPEGEITKVGYLVEPKKVGDDKGGRPSFNAKVRLLNVPKGSKWYGQGGLDARNVPEVPPEEVGCDYDPSQLASGSMQAIKPEGVPIFTQGGQEVPVVSFQVEKGKVAGNPRSAIALRGVGGMAVFVNELDMTQQVFPNVAGN